MSKPSFAQWMRLVDKKMRPFCGGMDSNDFVDICWRDLYDAGCEPEEALDSLADEDPIFAELWAGSAEDM